LESQEEEEKKKGEDEIVEEEEKRRLRNAMIKSSPPTPSTIKLSSYSPPPTTISYNPSSIKHISSDKKREYVSAILLFLAARQMDFGQDEKINLSLSFLAHNLTLQMSQLKKCLKIVNTFLR